MLNQWGQNKFDQLKKYRGEGVDGSYFFNCFLLISRKIKKDPLLNH